MHITSSEGSRGMLSQLTSERESITEPKLRPAFKKFRIVLIKPSKYDDDGYVIRFWKGVLPSNTLNVLQGPTEAVKDSRVFGDFGLEIVTFDETAERLPVRKIIRWGRRLGTKLVVGLVGVQTNQFPGHSIWRGSSVLLGLMSSSAASTPAAPSICWAMRNATSRRW
jgi:hypothetical protein